MHASPAARGDHAARCQRSRERSRPRAQPALVDAQDAGVAALRRIREQPVSHGREHLRETAELVRELFEQLGYPCTGWQVRERLAKLPGSGAALIAEVSVGALPAQIAGALALSFSPQLHVEPQDAAVTALVADRRFRHLGVGRALLAAAEGWARRNGCLSLHLRCRHTRDEAHGFYRAMGFEETHLDFEKSL